jgi:hypothetical protein
MADQQGTSKPLYQYLMKLRKADMQDIAGMFGDNLPDSWPKERMARQVADTYTQQSHALAAMFSYPVVSFLTALFDKKLNGVLPSSRGIDPVFGDMEQIYDQLEYLGLVDYIEGRIIVPEFLAAVVSKSSLPSPQQMEQWQEMELCALGMLDVYGLMEESVFLGMFCSCYPKLSRDQAYDFLSHRVEVRIMSYVMDMGSGFWWFSDLIEEPEEWYTAIRRRADISYRLYSRDEYIDFAVFAFPAPPRHYDELFTMLESSGMSEEDAETALAEDIMGHRSQLESHLDLPEFIRGIVGRQSMQEAKQILGLYIEFVNSIPIWYNKGNAPEDISLWSRSSQASPLRPQSGSIIPRKSNVIPFPTARKKTGRNEPCPCGSGKKYKDCCGKNKLDE